MKIIIPNKNNLSDYFKTINILLIERNKLLDELDELSLGISDYTFDLKLTDPEKTQMLKKQISIQLDKYQNKFKNLKIIETNIIILKESIWNIIEKG